MNAPLVVTDAKLLDQEGLLNKVGELLECATAIVREATHDVGCTDGNNEVAARLFGAIHILESADVAFSQAREVISRNMKARSRECAS